ncbi:MAG: alanine--tRNA ligase, partial [Clostridia bacterium]|nr:alanine--tRNA ligase [Clostridia bacterium]
MQGVDNMFEVDTNRRILDAVCEAAGKTYGRDAANDVSIRVCTDHIKSAMFMIADGVIPSNEGRGYVLRRIIRRACRHGKLLGIDRPFLVGLCRVAMQENEGAYPELAAKRDYILKVLSIEEERFDATIDAGTAMLSRLTDEAAAGSKTVSGEDAFRLYDTYGFPIDLTREIVEEKGLSLDEETFRRLMGEQRERARAARGNIGGWSEGSKNLLSKLDKTEFLGYDKYDCEAKVIALVAENELIDVATEGEVSVICDRTVFYGEGGGQVGDTGTLKTKGWVTLAVTDTKKRDGVYIHFVTVSDGSIAVGDTVTLSLDAARRDAIRRNHSACHLLQGALRSTLGNHVEQAGSYVDEHRCRFDFSHFAALTPAEIAEVEAKVNGAILRDIPVETQLTDMESAKKSGAMALFGEKYGKVVRMVKMGDASTELCGGTHVCSTGRIGLFRITSETSVAAGVRRIEAVTGFGVLALLSEKDELIRETAKELKAVNPSEIARRASQVADELKNTRRAL